MAITPPSARIWWREPVARTELVWIVIAFLWGLVMFFMMIYWHGAGEQNLSNEAYRISAVRFTDKTNAMVESHQVREESGFPVVHPPPGSDVYLIARLWQWWPIIEIDFLVTRGLVDGVLLAGCRTGDCHYRRGIEWMEQRIGGRRDPYLRRRVPRERVAWTWLGVDGEARLRERIRSLREDLRTAGPHRRAVEARGDAVAPDSSGAAPGDP